MGGVLDGHRPTKLPSCVVSKGEGAITVRRQLGAHHVGIAAASSLLRFSYSVGSCSSIRAASRSAGSEAASSSVGVASNERKESRTCGRQQGALG